MLRCFFSFKHQCPEGTIIFTHFRAIHCKYLHFLKPLVPVIHMSHRISFQVPFTAKVADRRDDSPIINQITTPRPHAADLGISLELSFQSFDIPSLFLSLTSLVVPLSPFQTSLKSPASTCSKIFFPLWEKCIPSGVGRFLQGRMSQKRPKKMLYQHICLFSDFFFSVLPIKIEITVTGIYPQEFPKGKKSRQEVAGSEIAFTEYIQMLINISLKFPHSSTIRRLIIFKRVGQEC